jgi:signal transduction histidine kinase
MRWMYRWWAVWVGVAIALAARSAVAHDRLMRRIGAQDGLSPQAIVALAQDERGFVWIGTSAGLHRYDGRTIRRWAAATVNTQLRWIRPAGNGVLFVSDELGSLFEVDAVHEAARPVQFEGRPIDGVNHIAVLDGELWIARADGVRRRSATGQWSAPLPLHDIRRMRASGGAIYAAGRHAVWRLGRSGGTRWVGEPTGPVTDVVARPDGTVVITQFTGEVFAFDERGERTLLYEHGGSSLAVRGSTLWVVSTDELIGLSPGRPPVVLGKNAGLRSTLTLLVEREGALLVGTLEGLVILPEPDTEIWTVFDGVFAGPRMIARTDEGYWITSWWGLSHIAPGDREAHPTGQDRPGQVCADGRGGWWSMSAFALVHHTRGGDESFPLSAAEYWKGGQCVTLADGTVWTHVARRIVRLRPGGAPEWFEVPAGDADPVTTIHVDRRDRLWISRGEQVCHAEPRAVADRSAWTCDALAPGAWSANFVETETGALWVATDHGGVYRRDEATGRWSVIPGSLALPSRMLVRAVASPRGGVWVLGEGVLVRVRERRDLAAGWDIVEQPGGWHGILSADVRDLREEADGDLWIVQNAGVHHVPRAVRDLRLAPPAVELLDVSVDGERRSDGGPVELPYDRHVIELGFAAPAFRDPRALRYRVRTDGAAAWSAPTDNPSLRLVALPTGAHRIEVAASLDGEHWSAVPASVDVEIGRPWYLRWWAIAGAAVLLVGLGVVIQRARMAIQLRLVRQRQQIAMDLHDEMGSGLGSIGILADLASSGVLADDSRREVATRIAETAGDLGVALGDIVWALRDRAATLDALVGHLVERARRLVPDEFGGLMLDLPRAIPPIGLATPVCRNVLRIALEALHNAARHARATRITFGVARVRRQAWRLWIEDDGIGLDAVPAISARSAGQGLAGMRQRAAAIGAVLTLSSPRGGGARVALVFEPGGRSVADRPQASCEGPQ